MITRAAGRFRVTRWDAGFGSLFGEHVALVTEGAQVLRGTLLDSSDVDVADRRLDDLARRSRALRDATGARLDGIFLAPFDRRSIRALAIDLDETVDLAASVAAMLAACRPPEPPVGAADQAALLVGACRAMTEAAEHLDRPTQVGPLRAKLRETEEQSHALRRHLVRNLVAGASDVRPVLVGRAVYDALRDAIDSACRAGHALAEIAVWAGPEPSLSGDR